MSELRILRQDRVRSTEAASSAASATSATAPAAQPIPVLLYHDVSAAPSDEFGLTVETFRRHMAIVAASGRIPLTIDEYVAGLPREPAGRPVLVTFDDGYRGFGHVLDIMAEAGVGAATLYVTTQRFGGEEQRCWSELADAPVRLQVGAHSRTHPQLDLLPAPRLLEEVAGAKDDVEQRLGLACRSFAYPHGHYGARVRGAVVDTGYASAAAVKNAFSHRDDDPFALARLTITQHTTDSALQRYLLGDGAPLGWTHERVRTKAFRFYRRHAPRGWAHV